MAGGFIKELKRRNVFRVAFVYGIAGWLLMQIADVMFPALTLPEWTIRFIAALLILGFPVALIFAWAFEMTPDGIKLEKNVDRTTSITNVTGRKLDFTVIGLLVAALAIAVGLHFVDGDDSAVDEATSADSISPESPVTETTASDRSIAVLPFVNMSPDPDNEYFSDGISEELLNLLVKVDGLTVASRTSSFRFKNKDVDIPTVAKQLNVRHVLEGSVRKSGIQVRVTAQLIDADTDKHLWSDTYDRELNDIFAIQDEIANKIVVALKETLGTSEIGQVDTLRPTENIEAYETYLQAIHIWRLRGIDNIKRSIELFEHAVELDPLFARAWSALASAYILVPVYSVLPEPERKRWLDKAQATARKASDMDPSLSEPHTTLAAIYENRGPEFGVRAEQEFLKAIEINPKSELAFQWYGEFLAVPGRVKECLENLQKAYQLDPASPVINNSLAYAYYLSRDYESGLVHAIRANELGLQKNASAAQIATLHIALGNYEKALEVYANLDHDHVEKLAVRAIADPGLRDQAIEKITGEVGSNADALPSVMLIWLGEKDVLLDDLVARAEKQLVWPGEIWQPRIMDWADDPRFNQVVEILGLHDFWRESTWPDHCEPAGPDGNSFRCGSDINNR